MNLELDKYIFIDNHAHSLLRGHEQLDLISFRQAFSESRSAALLKEHIGHSIHYMAMIERLAKLVGVKDEDALLNYRSKASGKKYLDLLWDYVSIGALIIDDGFLADKMMGTDELAKLSQRTIYRCRRIEPIIEQLLAHDLLFAELPGILFNRLLEASNTRTVALKSILAYRGGLELAPVTTDAARNDYDKYKREQKETSYPARITRRPLYDYLLLEIFQRAGSAGLPVQIHAGIGDDDADLRLSNPLCFRAVLESSAFRNTNFVFLHCHPFVNETAFLASLYGNVYMDLSLSVSLAAPLAETLITQALAQAPSTKILAGSDGHSVPETHWWGAAVWRESLSASLTSLRNRRYITENQSKDIAARILHGNAQKLYELSDMV